jgi:hypothetical protein
MTDIDQTQLPEAKDSDLPHYASFILRCWTGDKGQIHARLIDVNSGVGRPVADLKDLPDQVRLMMARMVVPGTS